LYISAIKPHIVEVLEKHRDAELTERREKRKKTDDKKQADGTASEQKMEVRTFIDNRALPFY